MPFENLFDILLAVLVAYYALSLLGLTFGVLRTRIHKSEEKPFVSVIVASRNEEAHLKTLLECLICQDYPKFEIIIVNDRSTDNSVSIIAQFQKQHSIIRRIDITAPSPDMPSKKHALAQGIANSRGEILAFTDADCLPPPGWVSALIEGFDHNVGLVAGYSPYALNSNSPGSDPSFLSSILHRFIAYEEFKGATWSAGSIGLNLGWLCTGRSLAYRRSVYDEVGGFESIKQSVSGDDDLFLQLVRRKTRWRTNYVTSRKSHVPTYPPNSFDEFVAQRTRHFSAGRYFSRPMKGFFFLFHLANLVMFLSFLAAIIAGPSVVPFWPYIVKCISDSLLFFVAAPRFHEGRFAPQYLFFEILIIFYNTLIGPLGFLKKFEWKPEMRS
jgi:cellulose synthase/poly-beta-1,6-N-acetylglucosamine synthase-like glycosyltransferase